jgi:hypothetical protein
MDEWLSLLDRIFGIAQGDTLALKPSGFCNIGVYNAEWQSFSSSLRMATPRISTTYGFLT